jgi:hypothetical protein
VTAFETSPTTDPTAQRHMPEHRSVQLHHCENLKCYNPYLSLNFLTIIEYKIIKIVDKYTELLEGKMSLMAY